LTIGTGIFWLPSSKLCNCIYKSKNRKYFLKKIFMTINDRIIVLINLLEEGIKRSFAKKAGIPEGTLSSIVGARRSDLSYTILKKIIAAYPEVNLEWLMNETGNPLQQEEKDQNFVLEQNNRYKTELKNTEISERITLIIRSLSLTPNAFASALGYQRSQTIYDIINGKSAPSYDFFRRFMLSPYSRQVNIDWLLTGRGKMNP